jgi:hypothetical protein
MSSRQPRARQGPTSDVAVQGLQHAPRLRRQRTADLQCGGHGARRLGCLGLAGLQPPVQ